MYDQIQLQVQRGGGTFKSLYNTSTDIQVWVWRWRGIKPNEYEGKDPVNKEFFFTRALPYNVQ